MANVRRHLLSRARAVVLQFEGQRVLFRERCEEGGVLRHSIGQLGLHRLACRLLQARRLEAIYLLGILHFGHILVVRDHNLVFV